MKGHPATGKSTLARALAQTLGWPLLDKDDIKDHTLAAAGGNELAYAILWQVVATQLSLGLSVIADSPLSYTIGYDMARKVVCRHGGRLLVVETYLAAEEWRRRLEMRSPAESAHKTRGWAAMQALLRRYDGCWQYPIAPEHHLVVDTGQPLVETVAQVQRRIGDGGQDGRQGASS
jgi:predicted kinase